MISIKYILKRILIGVSVLYLYSFISHGFIINVHAISMPSPTSIQVTNNNNSNTIYNGSSTVVSWYGGQVYSTQYAYRRDWNAGRWNFWYNGNLCANKVVNAQVTVMTYDSSSSGVFFNSLNRLKVWNGQSETSCAINSIQQNGKVGTFVCSFTDYGNSVFFINNLTFENVEFGVGIGLDSVYSCSPTTGDIIQSNQDQTNQIINNNNNNTTTIIQNNDSNTNRITQEQQETTDAVNNMNNSINNSNVSSSTGSNFFSNFQSNNHGLSGVLTAPLRLINSLSSSTCSSLSIPLPFVQQNAVLPCMSTIYSTYFPSFLILYRLITTGIIGYWVLIKIFGHVKGMQNPNDDRIEVFDL